jgi:tellurite resistance protein TehA-like permease
MIANNLFKILKISKDILYILTWKNDLILILEQKLQISNHFKLRNNKLQNMYNLQSMYVV